jgi:hypothetical protein
MSFFLRQRGKSDREVLHDRMSEILRELKDVNKRMMDIQTRMDTMENVMGERLPQDVLTERTFRQEVQSGDDIINSLMSRIEELTKSRSIMDVIDGRVGEKPGIVEARRIETITGLLQQHGKLSSESLASHTGLSRTRCSEYFKLMEEMGIVEPVLVGREKFYRLS